MVQMLADPVPAAPSADPSPPQPTHPPHARHLQAVRRITRLDRASHGGTRWDVITDRGPTSFRARGTPRRFDDGHSEVIDTSGQTYALPALDDLDPASRRMLGRLA